MLAIEANSTVPVSELSRWWDALAPLLVVPIAVVLKAGFFSIVDLIDRDDALLEGPVDAVVLSIALLFVGFGGLKALTHEGSSLVILALFIVVLILFASAKKALIASREIHEAAYYRLSKTQRLGIRKHEFKLIGIDLTEWKRKRDWMWKCYWLSLIVTIGLMVPIACGLKTQADLKVQGESNSIDMGNTMQTGDGDG